VQSAPFGVSVDLSLSSILVGVFISMIGLVLLGYGRREVRVPHMVVGLLLMVYPYFVGNLIIQIVIAVALVAGLALVSRLGY
jgi:hypothetical protein